MWEILFIILEINIIFLNRIKINKIQYNIFVIKHQTVKPLKYFKQNIP